MSNYTFIRATTGQLPSCKSHQDIPAEHLLGNTNWTQHNVDGRTISFTCNYCGATRTYTRKLERTLLNTHDNEKS